MKIKALLWLTFWFIPFKVGAQELLLINEVITWDMKSIHGFYFFEPPANSFNWVSPYNYYEGEFYTRFEIISQPTREPVGLQFGIWQWRPSSTAPNKVYTEAMSELRKLTGLGSIDLNNSPPSSWWQSTKTYNKVTYKGVDFSDAKNFWHFGINVWSLNPRTVISPPAWGGRDDVWKKRNLWFPIKVRATVVAVAKGHRFSGWEKYLKPQTNSIDKEPANSKLVILNPVKDELTIINNQFDFGTLRFRIFNLMGVEILNVKRPCEPELSINMTSIKRGLYIVMIYHNDTQVGNCKIIKE